MPVQFNTTTAGNIIIENNPVASTYSLTFPITAGSAGQAVLGTTLSGANVWGYGAIPTAPLGWTSSFNTAGTNATVNVTVLTPSGGSANVSIGLITEIGAEFDSGGAITTVIPDNATTGGNARGSNAIDLAGYNQRTDNSYVASGLKSLNASMSGKAEGTYSVCVGGQQNVASGTSSVQICGISSSSLNVGSYGVNICGENQAASNYSTSLVGTGISDIVAYSPWSVGGTGSSGNTGAGSNGTRGYANFTYASTTDATATYLSWQGNTASLGTLGFNYGNYNNSGAIGYVCYITALRSDGLASYYWALTGILRFTTTTITSISSSTLWSGGSAALSGITATVQVSAVSNYGVFGVQATGLASTAIKWSAYFIVTEVKAN